MYASKAVRTSYEKGLIEAIVAIITIVVGRRI